jgi:hypothetical protein
MLEQQLKLQVEQRFQAEVETRITELRTFCLRLSGSEWVALRTRQKLTYMLR